MANEYFHAASRTHAVGDRINRGEYLSDANSDPAYVKDDPNQEFLRERIRQEHFPTKPSRFNASYVFENLSDAVFFRDQLRPDRRIYLVRFADEDAPRHRVCYTAWNSNDHNLALQAFDYWDCPVNYTTGSEVFAESDLIVIAEV